MMGTGRKIYRLRVQGRLDATWLAWFEDVVSAQAEGDVTILETEQIDQGTLHGILAAIRDSNLHLLSINQIDR
jgi:hypothetical protein